MQNEFEKCALKSANSILGIVRREGYALFPRQCDVLQDIQTMVKVLNGNNVQVKNLLPKNKKTAYPNSLSSRFGFSSFPAHTDQALSPTPPNYLILTAPQVRVTKTLLYDPLRHPEFSEDKLRDALFRVQDVGKAYFSRLLTSHNNFCGNILRYNPVFMEPLNSSALEFRELLSSENNASVLIDWHEYQTVIVDNHRLLHSRSAVKLLTDSFLKRFWIWS